MDPKTNKRRGFVFITFKEEEAVKKVLEKKYHNVSGTKDTNGKEGLVSVSSVPNLLINVISPQGCSYFDIVLPLYSCYHYTIQKNIFCFDFFIAVFYVADLFHYSLDCLFFLLVRD